MDKKLCIDLNFLAKPCVRGIKETSKLRWFRRKNGELVLQNAFLEITKYEDGTEMKKIIWKDVETVCEE
ncbi:hypothetical protein NSA18_12200 [Pasteurella caecimuris]|uniref:hypothetical protein n=1 Tax=Rodentibacter caecimuris TaxID=1796644 RepID=UPI00214FF2AF|nr:hypothetical protein [Pasteurella caecimuris]MCR1838636.1 hypothetical protein [Pasteurella caecimuris]MCU0108062.1 hypothetical protein [Pasteurella caecimuris]